METNPYLTQTIHWTRADDPEFPYQAHIRQQLWVIRINDFPDMQLYTLLIDQQVILDFDNWPPAWKRPI